MIAWLRRWFRRSLILTAILSFVTAVLFIWSFVKYGTILGIVLVYPWVLSRLTGEVINPHLAKIVALFVATILWTGGYYLWKRNRRAGIALIVGLVALHSAFLMMTEKDRFYSVISGQPIKYYTENPLTGEYQIFDSPVYDAFGQKAGPVTFEVSQEIYRQQHSDQFPNEEVPTDRIKNFFDRRSGRALVFYCQNSTGYHFFLHDGYDTQTGRKLIPVTPEVVEAARKNLVLTPAAQGSLPSSNRNKPASLLQESLPREKCLLVANFHIHSTDLIRFSLGDDREQYDFVPSGNTLVLYCSPGVYFCTVKTDREEARKAIKLSHPGLIFETYEDGNSQGERRLTIETRGLDKVQYVKRDQPISRNIQASIGGGTFARISQGLDQFWFDSSGFVKTLVVFALILFTLALLVAVASRKRR